jgi:LmbE family N-acetylglucosaminyl deacetylase
VSRFRSRTGGRSAPVLHPDEELSATIGARPARTMTGIEDPVLRRLATPVISARILVVAPHPDDETIGAAVALSRCPCARVLSLTDGAPLDRRFWPAEYASREGYARIRLGELQTALAKAGVGYGAVTSLGAADQQLVGDLVPAIAALLRLFITAAVEIVITTPYEGGHPDHDAAAAACRAAVDVAARRGPRAPDLLEMTS